MAVSLEILIFMIKVFKPKLSEPMTLRSLPLLSCEKFGGKSIYQLVLPSRQTQFSLTTLEYLQAGLPIS